MAASLSHRDFKSMERKVSSQTLNIMKRYKNRVRVEHEAMLRLNLRIDHVVQLDKPDNICFLISAIIVFIVFRFR